MPQPVIAEPPSNRISAKLTSPSTAIAGLVNQQALADAVVLARSNQGLVYRLGTGDHELAIKAAAGSGPLLAVNR
ncbi:MAG: hypothetical protein WDZ60_06320, partial [Wenzhouxiangellaceae bacterium]